MSDYNWPSDAGDPTLIGWIITLVYLASAGLCFRAWTAARRVDASPSIPWLFLGACLLALGLNKQADLQTLLTDVMRHMAQRQRWYEQRAIVRLAFAGVFALTVCGFSVLFGWKWRAFWRRNLLVPLGFLALAVFLMIRILKLEELLGGLGVALESETFRNTLELLGVGCVGLSAARARPKAGPNPLNAQTR